MLVSLFQPAYSLLPVIGIFLCTVICIADQKTASASFLLWGQRQRHTNTDMGSLDCKSADNSSVKKHQEALCILAGCYHGTTYAHVLRRFYRIHGKSRENLEWFPCKGDAKSTTRTKSFRLRGLTFEKTNPEVLFYVASGRIFMLFCVLPDSNKLIYKV